MPSEQGKRLFSSSLKVVMLSFHLKYFNICIHNYFNNRNVPRGENCRNLISLLISAIVPFGAVAIFNEIA